MVALNGCLGPLCCFVFVLLGYVRLLNLASVLSDWSCLTRMCLRVFLFTSSFTLSTAQACAIRSPRARNTVERFSSSRARSEWS